MTLLPLKDREIRGAKITHVWMDEMTDENNIEDKEGSTASDLARDALLALLNEALRDDVVYTLDSMTTLPVKEDKGYRQRAVDAGEFLFDNVRPGARDGRIIFSFRPVDARPFKWIELSEKNICDHFPVIEERILHVLHEAESIITWKTDHLGGEAMRDGINQFLRARARSITKVRKSQAAALQAEKEKTYDSNPNWGAF